MSEWKKVKLGEIASNIQTGPFGSQLHQSDYSESGIPVVMPKDLVNGRISEQSIARVSSSHAERLQKHKIAPGDILYSRRGDVGRCAFAFENNAGWLCGTGCLRVSIDLSKAIPKFVFYELQLDESIGWVTNHAVGSTMLNLNTKILSNVPVCVADLETQNKICDILSAYDDLIENNNRQIKLLEEAAQRLYKEWFVDLHFPGYENCKIVDGVPEGWHAGRVGEIVEFRRGKTITKAQVKEGNVPVVAGGLEPAYYHSEANTRAPVITVSGSGANAGFSRMYYEDVFASDCSFADIQGTKWISFVYCFLKANKYQLDALQKGSAQPHVYAKDINTMEMVIPQSGLIDHYCTEADVLFNKIGVLQKQMAKASEARDRLLPKLMSGEIEV
jgi:type I restriction enzyme S subunit